MWQTDTARWYRPHYAERRAWKIYIITMPSFSVLIRPVQSWSLPICLQRQNIQRWSSPHVVQLFKSMVTNYLDAVINYRYIRIITCTTVHGLFDTSCCAWVYIIFFVVFLYHSTKIIRCFIHRKFCYPFFDGRSGKSCSIPYKDTHWIALSLLLNSVRFTVL